MKLIKQSIDPRLLSGTVTLLPTCSEDMWSCYNLLQNGDRIRASAIRRVTSTSASTGSTTSSRVHTTLTLAITALDFDARQSELHVSGRVAVENDYVKLGQFHTLDLELNRNFTVEKPEGGWDTVAVDNLREACDESDAKRAELWALLIDEGLASLCVVTQGTTVLRQTITGKLGDKNMPGYNSGMDKFFRKVLDTLTRAITFEDLKPVLLAGVGYTGQKFLKFIQETAQGMGGKGRSSVDVKDLRALLDKIVVEKAVNGNIAALREVLSSPAVQKRLGDARFAQETELLDQVFERIRKDDGRVVYGASEVDRAVEAGAVGRGGGILLIVDDLFRSLEVGVRKRWVALVDRVKDTEGGDVKVVSSMHESGQRLQGIGGVAALLTFPMFDEDDEDQQADAVRLDIDGQKDEYAADDLPEIEM